MDVVVDTRPLWIILAARSVRPLLMAGAVFLFWRIHNMPIPSGLTLEGQRALAVFVLCLSFWVFSLLPLMITSLLAIILLPLDGIMSSREAYALFGNEAVFFILGAFILAACLMKSGLSTRIALLMLRSFGQTPTRLLLSLFLLNAGMSFVMSVHAVAAMNFPIVVEIATVLRLSPRRSRYGRALFLSLAWGTTIGGIATFLGGGRAPLAVGILSEATGKTIGFSQWTAANLPVVLCLLVAGYVVITRFFRPEVTELAGVDAAVRERLTALGRVSLEEKLIGAIMVATVAAWVIGGDTLGLANIALSAVVLLFLLRLVRWRDVEDYVNWGLILLYGGAICLGSALARTGAAAWLADRTIIPLATTPSSVVLLTSVTALLLTEFVSNSAAVAILMPLSIGVANEFGMDPRIMAFAVAVPAGLAFTLPIGTPANALAYSSGFLRIRDMLLPGVLLGTTAIVVFNLVANWYWPLLGINLQ